MEAHSSSLNWNWPWGSPSQQAGQTSIPALLPGCAVAPNGEMISSCPPCLSWLESQVSSTRGPHSVCFGASPSQGKSWPAVSGLPRGPGAWNYSCCLLLLMLLRLPDIGLGVWVYAEISKSSAFLPLPFSTPWDWSSKVCSPSLRLLLAAGAETSSLLFADPRGVLLWQ